MNLRRSLRRRAERLYGTVTTLALQRSFDADRLEREEQAKFQAAGLDVPAGRERLDDVLTRERGRVFDPREDSIHWLLCSCAATLAPTRRVLEIGTFDGRFARILAQLWPDATITTVDLPDDDPAFRRTYDRDDRGFREKFLEKRRRNLDLPNIEFVQANSFFLLDHVHGLFDLVWVDGGHLFPDVAWDLCNGFHVCRPGGVMMCDDVLFKRPPLASELVSVDSSKVLRLLEDWMPGRVHYFVKRRHPSFVVDPTRRKYVAFLRKHDTSPGTNTGGESLG